MRMISIENQFKSEPFYLHDDQWMGCLRSWVATQKPFDFSQQSITWPRDFLMFLRHHLFLVSPVAIPEIFPQTQVSDY